MSDRRAERSSPDIATYRTADEIVRSILDDHASSPSEISPSGELYRAIERFHAHRQHSPQRDLVRSHLDHWSSASAPRSAPLSSFSSASMSSNQRATNSGNRRRFSREPQAAASPYPPRSLPPLRSLNNSRRPLTMSASGSSNLSGYRAWRQAAERYPARGRNPGRLASSEQFPRASQVQSEYNTQQPMLQESQDSPRRRYLARDYQQFDDEYAELDHANSQLRSLLDFTSPASQLFSELSFPSPPLQSYGATDESRRVKRRKLDSGRLSSGFKGFSYGKFGQVESGPLKMEMVSCDGGIFSDDGQSYAAENILRDDGTVYCTKGPRCNIVLRHQGTTCFTLKELVIKAPRSDYTSPVQEGMVFIAMDSDDEVFNRTARYQIRYLPYTEPIRQTREAEPVVVSIRHSDDPSMTSAQIRARRLYNIGVDDEDNEYRVPQLPLDFSVSVPPFRVTTECSDDEADSAAMRRALNRIGSLPFESDSSDDDEGNLDEFSGIGYRSRRLRRIPSEESEAEPDSGPGPDPDMAQQEPQASRERLLAPHARFFIERAKSKCTIRFDPPVSGRFILLKMWSSRRDPKAANIDIQAVVAKGFAGPRYFPDVELR